MNQLTTIKQPSALPALITQTNESGAKAIPGFFRGHDLKNSRDNANYLNVETTKKNPRRDL